VRRATRRPLSARPEAARRFLLLALAGAAILLHPARARADLPCPGPKGGGPTLAAVDPVRRLTWISQRLSRGEKNARLWTFGWGWGIAAAGVGSLIPVPFVAPDTRVDWYTGAVSAAAGVAAFVFAPPAILHDAPAVRAELARAAPDAEVCPLLLDAEARLVRDARDEAQQRRWYIHVGNILFNAGLGLFLGLGYHHWSSGVANALAGAAVGEAVILTSPTAAMHDLDDYLNGAL
jgi:hypothetical protein